MNAEATPARRQPVESALRHIEALRPLFDALDLPIGAIDSRGIWCYANDAFERLFKLKTADLVGTGPPYPLWQAEEREGEALSNVLEGDTYRRRVHRAYYDLKDSEGRVFPAKCVFVPLLDDDGGAVAHIGAWWDETPAATPVPHEHGVRHVGARQLDVALRRIAQEIERIGLSLSPTADEERPSDLDKLSAREREVLDAFVELIEISAIARALHVSRVTVRNHLRSIFAKLGVHSQVELMRRVLSDPSLHANEGAPCRCPACRARG